MATETKKKPKQEDPEAAVAQSNAFDHQLLDDVIHSRIRLAIIAVLVSVSEADFGFLKEKVNATDGNLSVHLRKLEEAKYITVEKQFIDRKPQSRYKLSSEGLKAFREYLNRLEQMVNQ